MNRAEKETHLRLLGAQPCIELGLPTAFGWGRPSDRFAVMMNDDIFYSVLTTVITWTDKCNLSSARFDELFDTLFSTEGNLAGVWDDWQIE